jgi:hypothetical protein
MVFAPHNGFIQNIEIKKSLRITKRLLEAVNRRPDTTMAKKKREKQ